MKTVWFVGQCTLTLFLLTTHAEAVSENEVTMSLYPNNSNVYTGGSVTFRCTCTKSTQTMNWYKQENNTFKKFADTMHSTDERFKVFLHDNKTATLQITNLQKNDSNKYYCGIISLDSNRKTKESNHLILNVEEEPVTNVTTTVTSTVNTQTNGNSKYIILGSALPVIIMFLILVSILLFVMQRKQEITKQQDDKKCLEMEHVAPVYVTEYGELEFPCQKQADKPVEIPPADNLDVEYATIVFIPELPNSKEIATSYHSMPNKFCGNASPRLK
ncbi:programmed cell death protein 1 [Protopterus annectens]|uniref:programmed cell death protein 1 n=1 Tax=Protopterus annectens TaxID=7888 RepID=UPI001CFA69D5|nr:programmed cell death protein 1 [Protopterus annectens]